MDILAAIFMGILLISLLVIIFFDPLEKYDKTLDDPDHKVFGGVLSQLYFGQWGSLVSNRMKLTFSSKDTKMLNALEQFVKGAEKHEDAMSKNDPATASEGAHQLMAAFRIIKKLDPSLSDLKSLLEHENVSVRSAAAARLLPIDEQLALPILEEIEKQKGRAGFNAHMVIQQWKKGELHFE
jgi:hypothetical protein